MFNQAEHVGIIVKDLDRSMRFYGEVLGLELIERRSYNDLELAFYRLGDTQIELIAHTEPNGSGDSVVNHLAFRVEDADAALKHLRRHGVTLENEEPVTVFAGHRIAFFRGPDGERLELFERADA